MGEIRQDILKITSKVVDEENAIAHCCGQPNCHLEDKFEYLQTINDELLELFVGRLKEVTDEVFETKHYQCVYRLHTNRCVVQRKLKTQMNKKIKEVFK